MAIFTDSKKGRGNNSPPPLIPIGEEVHVIKGSYPGHRATIIGHTPKMYHVRLESGLVTLLKQSSVQLATHSRPKTENLIVPQSACHELIHLELDNIRRSLDTVTTLLERMRLEHEDRQPAIK